MQREPLMKIATIPIGYYEGIDGRLSNKGSLKCCNNFCGIVGLVSMNITTVDVSSSANIKIGDEITIISTDKNDPNSIKNITKLCSTTSYEILVHISRQIERIVI